MRTFLALVAGALLLAGCGSGVRSAAIGDPAAPAPSWPEQGCEEHATVFFDFAVPTTGDNTPLAAARAYLVDGDRLVREAPQPPHQARGWMIVTPTHEIRAIVTMASARKGYVVDSAETWG